ncbi:MAG TPA: DNA-binding response regulator [Herpetosiphon sp.]|uniref:Two component transcriptional regulator, LuxR family n=1 Tax=Herpetosiphon aurantiacus (strain ATCC 23779 / DSM 785 / 114-95) TaxID=316274 RepID=A9AX03_HERA2|nr:response regulator transcription factor [Herpetosiphon sp.]ABX04811.1 two component transcriptional regulator, LuxR family [Herpetosiphon aurantiacus DSM 785]HBW52487.1 DNA-binding response regulator [Herpetosiphon sp.]
MIKLLICDDQAVVRDGLSIMLNLAPDLEVIAVASNGREAVQLSATWQPDLILMDLKMPIMNGIEATRQISAAQPLVKILVLTTYDDDEWLFEAIRAGAAGYLLKDMAHSDLVSAIRGTVSGKAYVDPNVTARLLSQVATSRNQPPASQLTGRLTERELAVLNLIATGHTNASIAEQLRLSEGTVRNHVSTILSKLDVADRTQAALLAVEHGLHQRDHY